jgi:NADH-quinone oxidoreductase subunit N
MNTLIYTSCLGLFCLLAEIINLRKFLIPAVIIAISAIFGVNYMEWNQGGSFYNDMVRIDHFSVAFSALVLIIGLLIFVLSADYYKNELHHISDYLAILIFTLCGALIMLSFSNMAMLFLGIEILSISLYIMAGSKRFDTKSNEAGFKYFLMGAFASGFLLFGIALIFGVTNSFNLEKIGMYVMNHDANTISPLFYIGMMLMLVAMLFKVAAAPFHFWSPDVYEGSPALITAFMSTLVKIAAFGALYRLFATCFIGTLTYANDTLIIAAVASLAIGNFTALHQTNFKRLMAYSGISHAGYMLLGIISLYVGTASALFYYSAGYAFATIGAFAIAIPVFHAMQNEGIDAFNGLGKKNPLLAALLTMSMLSLAGIPPFAGFLGKYYIFSKAIQSGHMYVTLIAIIASMIGAYYYLKVVLAMYTKEGNDTEIEVSPVYIMVAVFCVLMSLMIGLFPDMLMNLI